MQDMQAFHKIPYGSKDLKKLVILHWNNSKSITKKSLSVKHFSFLFSLWYPRIVLWKGIFSPQGTVLALGKVKFSHMYFIAYWQLFLHQGVNFLTTASERTYVIGTHAGLLLFNLNGIGRVSSQIAWIKLNEGYLLQPLPSLLPCKTKQDSLLPRQKAQPKRS